MAFKALPSDPGYLKAAFADLGLSEIGGKKHNARVVELFALSGHPEIKDDETAWCAAAVGGWLKEGGYPNTGSLMARSYVKYGMEYDLKKHIPRGTIIVWPRGRSPSGHVNICIEDNGTYLTCIGGNQWNGKGGGVTISRDLKKNAIAARIPIGFTVRKPAKPKPEPVEPPPPPPDIEPVEPKVRETLPEKVVKLAKSKTQWAATGTFVASVIGALTDWRIWAVIVGGALAGYIIYERSKK